MRLKNKNKQNIRYVIYIFLGLVILYLYCTHNLYGDINYIEKFIPKNEIVDTNYKTNKKPVLNKNYNADNVADYIKTIMQNVISSGLKAEGPVGPPGERGPRGKQGKTGGLFHWAGFLRNVKNDSNKNGIPFVVDRTANTGKNTKCFLNTRNNMSNQIWTLNSDDTLENQYGGCMTATDSGDVYIGACKPDKRKFQWEFNNSGQLLYKKNNKKCLSLSKINQNDSYTMNGNGGQWGKESSLKGKYGLHVDDCDMTRVDQRWFFN